VHSITSAERHARPRQAVAEEETCTSDEEDVMSTTRPLPRPIERLAARRSAARSRRELQAVLAGHHGEGVRADVLAAMKR
jgi:hypothetical protein